MNHAPGRRTLRKQPITGRENERSRYHKEDKDEKIYGTFTDSFTCSGFRQHGDGG